jgi:predicted phosphoribosyltransferase
MYGCRTARQSSHRRNDLLKQVSPFSNLTAAGRELAPRLAAFENDPDAIVLGIALGGVPVAREVANFLRAPLDLIFIRRLLAPEGPDSLLCAVNVAGSLVIDDGIKLVDAPLTPIEHFLADAVAELQQREQLCRRGRAPIDIAGRTVILVDCAIRTGSTIKTSMAALRKMRPTKVVGAAPVASPEGYAAVRDLFDELIVLAQPQKFGNAGVWYRDFSRPDDDHVGELLDPIENERI